MRTAGSPFCLSMLQLCMFASAVSTLQMISKNILVLVYYKDYKARRKMEAINLNDKRICNSRAFLSLL